MLCRLGKDTDKIEMNDFLPHFTKTLPMDNAIFIKTVIHLLDASIEAQYDIKPLMTFPILTPSSDKSVGVKRGCCARDAAIVLFPRSNCTVS